MSRLLRLVVLPLLLLLGVLPGGGAPTVVTVAAAANARVHTLDAVAPVPAEAALQSASVSTIACLGVAPRQAWQSRHEQLKPNWDVPIPARTVVSSSGIDARESYLAMIRVAATGSVSFRATSLPPPEI